LSQEAPRLQAGVLSLKNTPRFRVEPEGAMTSFFKLGIEQNQREFSMRDVPVEGVVPDWLSGSYIRNGPGMFSLEKKRLSHWFDGQACLHRFGFHLGKVSYQNRFLECDSYKFARQDGDLKFSEFATDPCQSLFRKTLAKFFPSLPNITDNAKVNLAKIGEKYMALGETPMQIEFDPETLQKTGKTEYAPGSLAYKTTAHPHFENGSAYNVVMHFGMVSFYKIYDTAFQKKKPLASIPVMKPAYLHGFGMSENYFIIVAGPLTVVPLDLLFWKRPFIESFNWNEKDGTQIYIIEKNTGKLKAHLETEAGFHFHHVNAWEENNDLFIDINEYDSAEIVQKYYLKELEKPEAKLPHGTLRRYRIDLREKKVKEHHKIAEACLELPRMDYERLNTKNNYGFVYGVSLHPTQQTGFYNALVKINTRNGDAKYWYSVGCYPGEPMFLPKPGSRNDEDGILLSAVLDTEKENSFLLILDAKTMQETARATVAMPILYGFHGDYFSQ
jgi:beta,beta-carotene 9',10'-dioxygenase